MTLVARVIVTPKPVVNDPQGVTVRGGLEHLGFAEVRDVRVGKYIEIRLDAPSEEEAGRRVEAMCQRLLANHVIEDFRFELGADPGEPAGGAVAGTESGQPPAYGAGWEAPSP